LRLFADENSQKQYPKIARCGDRVMNGPASKKSELAGKPAIRRSEARWLGSNTGPRLVRCLSRTLVLRWNEKANDTEWQSAGLFVIKMRFGRRFPSSFHSVEITNVYAVTSHLAIPNNKAQRKTSSTVQIAAFLLVFCDMAEEEGFEPPRPSRA
jgi:hypothetical protein